MLSPKELKKFVATCRKLGVSEFTSPEFSFKLTEVAPTTPRASKAAPRLPDSAPDKDVPQLSDEALLFWSSIGMSEAEGTQ